jgi:hypothetical protein
VEAYTTDAADADKNQRVSVLEAFEYARLAVSHFYEEENLLMTEHAQLEDGGGKAAAGGSKKGDTRAAAAFLTPLAAADGLSAQDLASDPELAHLVERRQELEGRVEALKLQKDSMPEETYLQELERLLVDLAAVTQQIEERSKS